METYIYRPKDSSVREGLGWFSECIPSLLTGLVLPKPFFLALLVAKVI